MTKNVAIIGAGTMGRGIAQVFAQSGYEVRLFDSYAPAIQSATQQIGKMLDRAVEKGRMSADDAGATKGRIQTVEKLADVGTCALIVEAIIEKPEAKIEVLREAQKHLSDDGVLASNTSSISITQLAAAMEKPDTYQAIPLKNPQAYPPSERLHLPDVRNSLKSLMWRAAGIPRTGTELQKAAG